MNDIAWNIIMKYTRILPSDKCKIQVFLQGCHSYDEIDKICYELLMFVYTKLDNIDVVQLDYRYSVLEVVCKFGVLSPVETDAISRIRLSVDTIPIEDSQLDYYFTSLFVRWINNFSQGFFTKQRQP